MEDNVHRISFLRHNHYLMMVATRSHHFFLFAILWHSPGGSADCSHTFFCCRLLTAYQATTPHHPIPSIESYHFPSMVFTLVCHPQSRSTDFSCSLSSSFVFPCLRRRHSSLISGDYFPISLLFHSPPSVATGGPGDSNNSVHTWPEVVG